MADISQITLPNGNVYKFKDDEARASAPVRPVFSQDINSSAWVCDMTFADVFAAINAGTCTGCVVERSSGDWYEGAVMTNCASGSISFLSHYISYDYGILGEMSITYPSTSQITVSVREISIANMLAGTTYSNLRFPVSEGTYCFTNGDVYKAIQDITQWEAFNAEHWEPVTMAYELLAIKANQLPSVTSSDNGKVLRVVNGAWAAVALPSASGVSF